MKFVKKSFIDKYTMNIKLHFAFALLLRLILIIFGCIQDAFLDVKYTDIDYFVFTDAAKYVSKGFSPFKRYTYRYTPFLSYLLLPNIWIGDFYGKIFFSILDILTSMLIFRVQKKAGVTTDICRLCTFMWLYNPLPMVISTRGNAESVMTFLILLSIYFHQVKKPFMFGIVYGLSVHFKIYPCIYVLSFYFTYFSPNSTLSGWKKLKAFLYPNPEKLIFVLSTLSGFAFPTLISFVLYGDEYVREALLYHMIRKDIRHNFSPYFYLLYLSELIDPKISAFLSFIALLIQGLLIMLVSWVIVSPQMLPAAMFLQTFIFVSFNKIYGELVYRRKRLIFDQIKLRCMSDQVLENFHKDHPVG
ncbi:GPI mannosyltransferase 1 like protein [Argiope bruennichi]|uniref:GPI alpha-1,4-mannosyltransferase I, catalytic subunit n=1 Tax=Argiope bruennichi TaxID=94029 RepID=A0A8T0FSM3_ARGBR|nr:GPI mannosyltransferase 1 like protein [Argiope bruennichi]